ncbi:MAG: AAA family ATPase, partial [Alphaproteobacteria bacterium]|nr:AAA family ATPase [Alphaproteobacteria bacterium]
MLSSLFIQNVVLIDKLSLPFEGGLTVLTGETGAGKSILLDSLSLALGERADTGLIRHGEESLSVSATFDIDNKHPALSLLAEQGMDKETTLILRRTLTKDGKSKAFINDMPVSIGFLKNVGNTLVEIHGQFATHGLLNSATHLSVLDSYGGIDTTAIQNLYTEWKNKKEAVKIALDILEKAKTEEEYLRHSVRELESFNTYIGEEEELSIRRNELMNAEKITESLNEAYGLLSGRTDDGISSLLHQAERALEKASRFTPSERLTSILEHLQKTEEELNDAVSLLEEEASEFEDPTYELEQIDGRFFALKDLARKYRVLPDELPSLLAEYQKKITTLDKGEEELIQLQKEESS